MSESILVVAAHPDDEVLGCGATMARHAARGDSVHVLILAEGVTSRSAKRDRKTARAQLSALARCAEQANSILGASSVSLERFPDNRLDSVDRLDLIKVVEDHVARIAPASVYTHNATDLNVDHRRVHEAVATACRPLPGTTVRRLLFFEVPSSTEWQVPASGAVFTPTVFIDVSKTLKLKIDALEAYATEMREFPHPRSLVAVKHLAKWRGASVGVQAAEAFMLGREIL